MRGTVMDSSAFGRAGDRVLEQRLPFFFARGDLAQDNGQPKTRATLSPDITVGKEEANTSTRRRAVSPRRCTLHNEAMRGVDEPRLAAYSLRLP